ncbi:hypothetical protein MKW92_009152, partial [Papaver armeniacum]
MHDRGSLTDLDAKKAKFDNGVILQIWKREESNDESKSANDSIASRSSTKKLLILRLLIISYLNKHHNEENNNSEEMLKWDKEFFEAIDNNEILFDLVNASNYLDIRSFFFFFFFFLKHAI